jgi:hypothetical protein
MLAVYVLLAAYLICLYLAYRGAAAMDEDIEK